MQWWRGIRAGVAIVTLMTGLFFLGRPTSWAAFGVLLVMNVDNGGPYRSRFANMVTVTAGGTLALVLAAVSSASLPVAILVTSLFCFGMTLTRVVSQPLAAGSASILICYFVSHGSVASTRIAIELASMYFVIGGVWAAAFSLFLWPADPFGPARSAVADVYAKLTELSALPIDAPARFKDSVHQIRGLIETAQDAMVATPARMTARTVRAHNLTIMLQAADLLFARQLRLAELCAHESIAEGKSAFSSATALSEWLTASLKPIEAALRRKPQDRAIAFGSHGRFSVRMQSTALRFKDHSVNSPLDGISSQLESQLASIERECLLSLEIVYESLRAIWTGSEPRNSESRSIFLPAAGAPSSTRVWLDTLRANLTPRSVMFRHALRLATIAAVDILVSRRINMVHSYWMPMTSIIVLQPYTGETWRKSIDRVAGTVAGAIFAAGLAAALPSEAGVIAVVSIGSIFALALYKVDYALYSFFITLTILRSQPHLGDWHLAAVRTGMTLIGALTALLGMLLLWPQRESTQLPRLLARAAAMNASLLRALINLWQQPKGDMQTRILMGRRIFSPARRACGLASNDAEDSLDRALLEQGIPLRLGSARMRLNQDALTFTTYVRRLSQSITTLVTIGADSPELAAEVSALAARLDRVSDVLTQNNARSLLVPESAPLPPARPGLAGQQMIRIKNQVEVIERAAASIAEDIQTKPV